MTVTAVRPVVQFSELGRGDVEVAGGKGANLGELTRAGFPVPPGFVVTAGAFLEALEAAGVRDALRERAAAAPVDDPEALTRCAAALGDTVRAAGMPPALAAAVLDAYHRLDPGDPTPIVAVRSSATAEDTAGTSFAGMNQTFTNVVGDEALLARIVDCWVSLYGPRVLAYRASQGLDAEPAIAVVVQQMLLVESSGVCFTADPGTSDPNRIVIEAALGQGEVVVSGQVEPDTYVVDKATLAILGRRVGVQTHRVVRGADGADVVELLDRDRAGAPKLDDEQVRAVAELARRVEAHYGEPQDLEFAFTADGLFLVQSRPITTLQASPAAGGPAAGEVLLHGQGAAPGVVSGQVRVLASPEEAGRLGRGEILVATMTNPDWVPALRRAGAVVTDGGGITCHAAIISRELGVPCVVGTRRATTALSDG